jgi:CDP-diglyceride synthetase
LRLRLATGVTGAAVVVGAIWLGAPWLTLLALLGGGLAVRETYRLTPPTMGRMPVALGVTAVAALLLASEAASGRDFHLASGLVLAAWAFAALLWFIACYRGEPDEPEADGETDEEGLYEYLDEFEPEEESDEYESAGWGERPWLSFLFLLLGPVYAGFLLGHGLVIRDLPGDAGDLGRSWLLFTLLVVFACDTGALAVGRLLGRHRMAPRVSPNKTWEGAAGGFAASIGAALLVGLAFELAVPVWQQAVIGAVASVAAQVGDLLESALKRAANVKDSGSIMPGHGGILDRMDSILFALPAVFYMLLAVGLRL